MERPYLEWLHQAGCLEVLQDQLEAEDQDACMPIKVLEHPRSLSDLTKRGTCYICIFHYAGSGI